jgi:sugar-specific transcriptional regulator TrmB
MEVKPIEIVSELRGQISRLIALYQDLKLEKEKLVREKMDLLEQVETLSKENEESKHQYDTLKLAKTFAVNTGDSQQAKNKISQIVREIDKCIALLNK